ncbi:transmembrane and TPR repeat-containing protein 4 [Fopius arisanus]|uniref:dolichyl-phosphate-mannose--protein mannosyltransferase n=1 Tax=Fopius arisanus TaxID=64838 RepID=A0A9R1TBQ6_9HYME|nr:PREDICTED: transmembrane and TPR repeat-containing protein 4 [Fopius arisanus]
MKSSPGASIMGGKGSPRLPVLSSIYEVLIVLMASFCFLNSYDGDFVFDDSPAVVNNPDVSTSPLGKVFVNDFWGNRLTHKQSHRSYRPLTILTFRIHHWLRGHLEPTDFHIINLILHSVVSVLTLIVFKKLVKRKERYLAFYGAVLFAVHPIHCEAVSGIVGRADVLSAMFVWLSILSYDKTIYCNRLNQMFLYLLMCVMFITAGMLCKETGITAIGLCVVYEFTKLHEQISQGLWTLADVRSTIVDNYRFIIRLSTLIVTGVVLMGVRFSLMGFSPPTFQAVDNPTSFLHTSYLRYLNYQYIYSLNLWLLICPHWLSFDWSMGSVPLIIGWDLRLFAIIGFWCFLLLFVVVILRTPRRDQSRYILTGLCFLVIPFLPGSNLFFPVGFVLAERTLYLPSAGYCLLLAVSLQKLCEILSSPKLPLLMYTILIITWFTRSWSRSAEWRTEVTLFRSALNVCPLNAKAHYNVAKSAADLGNVSLAEIEYREALRLHPEYSQAMNNLGNLLKDQGRFQDAEHLLRRSIELQEDFAAAWMNLGIVLSALKKFEESESCYMTSLLHRPNCPDCYYNLGILYMEQKRYSKALVAWEDAISRKLKHRRAWTNTIRLLDDLELPEKALEMGEKAMELFPEDALIRLNIANILGKLGRFPEAEEEFRNALRLDPRNPTIFTNLGVLYHRWHKYSTAEEMYMKALEINPGAQSALDNMKKLQNLLKKQKLKVF